MERRKHYHSEEHYKGIKASKDGVNLLIIDKSNPENRSIYPFSKLSELYSYIKSCGGRSQFKGFFVGIYTKDDRYFLKNKEWHSM